jgi:hypothetical protein
MGPALIKCGYPTRPRFPEIFWFHELAEGIRRRTGEPNGQRWGNSVGSSIRVLIDRIRTLLPENPKFAAIFVA